MGFRADGNERLTIAHVLGSMNHGGVESMALQLIQGLSKSRFSHVVVSMSEGEETREKEFRDLVEIRRCPYHPPHRLTFIKTCASLLREINPARVLAYNFGNHAMVSAAAKLARVSAPYVRVAGAPLRDPRTRWKSMVLAHLARPFCRGEIAVSRAVEAELTHGLRLPHQRIHVIPNGCNVEKINRRAVESRRNRKDRDRATIIMVSRMDDAKDHPTLLRAVQRLIDEKLPVALKLAGDGPWRSDHEALRADLGLSRVVSFMGNRDDVPELMGGSDLLVHATHTEGSPNVLIEAMAAELPIIATDLPACREILDNGRCGFLVRPRDPDALAAAIKQCIDDPTLSQRLTEAAAERVRSLYDIRLAVGCYSRLLAGHEERPKQ